MGEGRDNEMHKERKRKKRERDRQREGKGGRWCNCRGCDAVEEMVGRGNGREGEGEGVEAVDAVWEGHVTTHYSTYTPLPVTSSAAGHVRSR